MDYVGKIGNLFNSVHAFYNEINPATLSGAIDIIVVEQKDGDLACSPFHVRFGKLSLLMPQEKKVEIKVNGNVIPYMMKVGEAGESFFVFETEHDVPEAFQTSPIMGAVSDSKIDEEPPYLDIGESKAAVQGDIHSDKTTDTFDEDDGVARIRIPAELQSPKIIIEEQIDKVVTKMDCHDLPNGNQPELSPRHDTYPLEDGATLLERLAPEAITSTTVAKETFIVRPADGDIYSTWLEVTHASMDSHGEIEHVNPDNPHRPGDSESIVLDIAGYKTGDTNLETKTMAANTDEPTECKEQSPMFDHLTPQQTHEILTAVPNHHQRTSEHEPKSVANTQSVAKDTLLKSSGDHPLSLEANLTSIEIPLVTAVADLEIKDGHTKPLIPELPKMNLEYNGSKADDAEAESTDIVDESNQVVSPRVSPLKPGVTYRIEISLCGLSSLGADSNENDAVFASHQITYDHFVHNPNLLNDRRLVFRYEGRYFTASRTGPLFPFIHEFRNPISDDIEDNSSTDPESRDTYSYGRGWRQWLSRSSIAVPPSTPEDSKDHPHETTTFTTTTKTTSVGWSPDHVHPDEKQPPAPRKNFAKTLRLTSEQLKNLNLKKGVNSISFSVTSAYQGTATCSARIFFWDYDVDIVISDIDGTITKSDALGHVFTMIGKDWTHTGVAKLYTDVCRNGYKILYLTSRAIGQADYTRDYLRKVEQNKYQLPDGPVIMSPDRLFTSLHREVILRKPELFKMACLKDVLRLFDGRNPFYAGFGNRITDAISYRSVNVPPSRIFTIDPNGELKLELLLGFKSSYIDLNDLVDQIFPAVRKAVHAEFNDWNYWKPPLPEIELPDLQAISRPTSPKPKPIQPDPSVLPASSVVAVPERRQRGILRSFTSISSSSSTPNLLSRRTSAESVTFEPTRASSVTDQGALSDDQLSPALPPLPTSDNASPGIMNKVFSGVFSRRFSKSPSVESPKTDNSDDTVLDSAFGTIGDDIDMDNIPFI